MGCVGVGVGKRRSVRSGWELCVRRYGREVSLSPSLVVLLMDPTPRARALSIYIYGKVM